MTSIALALALMTFFPHLDPEQASLYARAIVVESRRAGVDPLDTASRAWVESGYRPRAVRAGTYGLMQTRLRTFDPVQNIREGVRVLAYWQRWHRAGKCRQRPAHPYWLHYTWGYVVPPTRRTPRAWKMDRVRRLLRRAVRRARAPAPAPPSS